MAQSDPGPVRLRRNRRVGRGWGQGGENQWIRWFAEKSPAICWEYGSILQTVFIDQEQVMKKGIGQGIQYGLYALILACAACSESDVESHPDNTTESKDMTQKTQQNSVDKSSIGENLDQQVSGAVSDLVARRGITKDKIIVKEARAVHWGSGAMGCPEEGMNYTQAIVPGILVILEANGVMHSYHGGMKGKLIYCPKERAQIPG